MSEVIALPGVVVDSSRKQAWLDLTASLYDSFVEAYGREPDMFVGTMLGGHAHRTCWDAKGVFEPCPAAGLAFASQMILGRLWRDDEDASDVIA